VLFDIEAILGTYSNKIFNKQLSLEEIIENKKSKADIA